MAKKYFDNTMPAVDVEAIQHRVSGKNEITELVAAGAGVAPYAMTWNIDSRYKNDEFSSTLPIYKRNFQNESIDAKIPRLDAVGIGSGNLTVGRTLNGLNFTNSSAAIGYEHYRLPAKFKAPSGILRLDISNYSAGNIRIGIMLVKDANNHIRFSWEPQYSQTAIASLAGGVNNQTNYAYVNPDSNPFSLILLWANEYVYAYIESTSGLKYIGEKSIVNQSIVTESKLQDFHAGFFIYAPVGENITLKGIDCGYYQGYAHADIKSVTYEDGSPVVINDRMYITASSRVCGRNGASAPITIYEIDNNGRIIRPVSQISTRKAGELENGTSAKLLYDRDEKQWIYAARAFPSPGGKVNIGTTKANLLKQGVHVIDVADATQLSDNSLDADLIKQDGVWTIAYHGGTTRVLRVATSPDLVNWTEIFSGSSGEGLTLAKTNGQWYILEAKTQLSMGVRLLSAPATEIGTITLSPSPGIEGVIGGNPWGTLIPLWDGDKTKFLLIVFTRDEYIEDATHFFTYGEIWSYVSKETESGAEFYIKPQVELGY